MAADLVEAGEVDIEPIEALGVGGERQEVRSRAGLKDAMGRLLDAEIVAQLWRPPQHLPGGGPDDLALIAGDGRGIGLGPTLALAEGAVEGERREPSALAVAPRDPDARLAKAPPAGLALD